MASPDLSVSTPSTSLASGKEEPPPPTIQFTSIKKLCQVIYQVSGDFLIVQNVSPTDFEQISNRERRGFRVRRYYPDKKLLIIVIPTQLHEALHLGIFQRVGVQLGQRAPATWNPLGSTTFRSRGHPGGDGGEGDSAGGPVTARSHKGAWPTLVIEAGVSESLGALQADMRWWFSASDHQVKIVVLVKFNHLRQEIRIERWEEEHQTRSGATTTRRAAASPAVQPVIQQEIKIIRDLATDSYNVTRSALLLKFRLLFLRDPGPGEGDIVISIADLQEYARIVWNAV
ncbi:hypothetical protein BR93DRAFT_459774 [Coniochaeta sp. PMI_546]|nr:hypothetical protein BR93DRAFT_459774 [Coniochaeta sp. PMI_546]